MISGIIMLPIYIKFIQIDIYGGWLATGNLVYLLSVIDPGISDILRQRVGISFSEKNRKDLGELFGSGLILSIFVAIVIIFLGYFLYLYLFSTFHFSDDNSTTIILQNAFFLSTLSTAIMIVSYCLSSFNQGLLDSKNVGIIYLVASLSSIICTVILLFNNFGIYSIPIGQIISGIILTVGNLYLALSSIKNLTINISYKYSNLIQLLKLSGFNIIGRLGIVMSSQIDSILITKFLNPAMTTIFSISRKGPEISRLVIERSAIGLMPAITNLWGAGELIKVKFYTIRIMNISIWLLGFFFSSFLMFNESFIDLWIGRGYYSGDLINLLICICVIFSVVISITSNLYFSLGNTKQTGVIFFIQGVLTVSLSILGTKHFGLIGLVSGQVIAMSLFSAWYFPVKLLKALDVDVCVLNIIIKEVLLTVIINSVLIIVFEIIVMNFTIKNWETLLLFAFSYANLSVFFLFVFSKSFRKEFLLIRTYVFNNYLKRRL